ncbi:MAG: hypothetical protein ACPL6C_04080, partial [bacterium]
LRREMRIKSGVRMEKGFFDCEFSFTYRFEDYGELIWRDEWVQRLSWEKPGGIFSGKVTIKGDRFYFGVIADAERYSQYDYEAYGDRKKRYSRLIGSIGMNGEIKLGENSSVGFDLKHNRDEFHPGIKFNYPSISTQLRLTY